MILKIINPYTTQVVKSYDAFSFDKIEEIINHANQAFLNWRSINVNDRANKFLQVKDLLLKNKNDYAKLITTEMGKPIKESRAEIEKCATLCEYYSTSAAKFLQDEIIKTEAQKSYVSYQPLGVILAIMPWNFPFWQVFRFAVPTLIAGNTAILKHASNVTGCSLEIENIFNRAGFPNHVFNSIVVSSKEMNQVIANKHIKAVTLTGSTNAGKAVASEAGKYIKKSVLELGGSDPYIILQDADIKEAAKLCVKSRLINAGQSCIAAKRFIVDANIYDEFCAEVVKLFKGYKLGDPLDEATDIGPLARKDLVEDLAKQVQRSIKLGALSLFGSKKLTLGANSSSSIVATGNITNGCFFEPTVLTNVKRGMPAYDEELFGPVAIIIKSSNENDAIAIANDTSFGLGSAIFTKDLAKGEKIAKELLNSGSVFVNDFVRSDPRLPFGGVNESGFGRELGTIGIKEFVNIKTIYIK